MAFPSTTWEREAFNQHKAKMNVILGIICNSPSDIFIFGGVIAVVGIICKTIIVLAKMRYEHEEKKLQKNEEKK